MTIDPELLTDCRKLAAAVDPDSGERLNLFDAAGLEGLLPPNRSCMGFALSGTDYNFAKQLGSGYDPTAPLIVLDGKAIAAASQPGQFGRCVLNVMVHELGHVLGQAPISKTALVEPTAQLLRWQAKQMHDGLMDTSDGPDSAHGVQFIRRTMHCLFRSLMAGFDVPIGSLLTWPSHAEHYMPVLLREALLMRDQTFAEIEATDMPQGVHDQFKLDCDFYTRFTERNL